MYKNESTMSAFLFEEHWVYMPVTFLHFRSPNYTPQRAMNVATAYAPVQICSVIPKQPTDLFCKIWLISIFFFFREIHVHVVGDSLNFFILPPKSSVMVKCQFG